VLVVDDSADCLRAAASVVAAAGGLRLVGSVASGEEAIRLLPDLRPDLVLLDVHMPESTGVRTPRIIQRQDPRIVVVRMSADPAGRPDITGSAGAAAFLHKAHLRPDTLDALWLEHRPAT
jgi:two-component system chemotaxis response regulator CheB